MRWGDYGLDTHYLQLADEAKALLDSCSGWIAEDQELSSFSPRMLAAFAKSGLAGLVVPASHGGRNEGVDPLAFLIVREALAGGSPLMDDLFSGQALGSYPIALAGSDAVRSRFLPQVATAECLPALALTEPDAGSDLRALKTTLTADGDELIVTGHKAFISNAGQAGFYTVLAKEADGHSFVVVPADAEGLSVTPGPDLISPHVLGEVVFEECRIPVKNRVGAPGHGWPLLLSTLSVFRAGTAASAVGLADAALDIAVAHTSRREQFGRPLAKLGPVAQILADCVTEVEMARLITYRAGAKAKADPLGSLGYSSMAKVAATEMASRVADRCIQVMGRWGLMKETRVEGILRAVRPMRIYEGATEVLRLAISKEACAIVAP